MSMRIGIIGAGAIGCMVGGLLTRAGHDVTLADQWPEHVEAMRRDGLRLSGTCGELLIPVKAIHLHELQRVTTPFDAVFIAVKSYDTEWATALGLSYLAKPHGVVVDFQNGINDERVAAVAGRERTLGCVILIAAGMYEPGHAIRTDAGSAGFKIGEHDGRDTPRARALAEAMSAVAPTTVTTNLWGERWSKLAINCMANPHRRAVRSRHRRAPHRARAAPAGDPPGRRGGARGPRARLRDRADLGDRPPSASSMRPRERAWTRSRPISAATRSRAWAAGRRCSRT